MIKKHRRLQCTLAVLGIVLLAAYVLVGCLPHRHCCVETDCILCNGVDSSKKIIPCVILLAIAHILPRITLAPSAERDRITLSCNGTPVRLKVKLSD